MHLYIRDIKFSIGSFSVKIFKIKNIIYLIDDVFSNYTIFSIFYLKNVNSLEEDEFPENEKDKSEKSFTSSIYTSFKLLNYTF